MDVTQIIELARTHLDEAPMRLSAAVCLSDAEEFHKHGAFEHAKRRALRSLAYSIGISHPDYLEAAR